MSKQSDLAKGTFSGDLTVDTNTLVVDSANNKVGVGTASPSAKLHIGVETEPNITNQTLFIQGSKTGYAGIPGLPLGQLFIYDDTASTVNSGGAIGFGANTGSSQRTWIASINSQRDSATTDGTNYGGSLNFYTRPPQSTPLNRMKIDSAGRVTMPYQPHWSGYNLVSNYGAGTYTSTLYTGAGTLLNTGGHWNGTRFTCPVAGLYQVHAHYMKDNSTAGNGHLDILVNSSMYTGGRIRASEGATYDYASGTYYIQCSTSDFIEFYYHGVAGIFNGHSAMSIRLVS
jgi:hypothetical protein